MGSFSYLGQSPGCCEKTLRKLSSTDAEGGADAADPHPKVTFLRHREGELVLAFRTKRNPRRKSWSAKELHYSISTETETKTESKTFLVALLVVLTTQALGFG
ncbi:hypothetical protein ACFX14_011841 [Malus domestica]